MARQAVIRKKFLGEMHVKGSWLRDFILGWQDGLVNVLGVVLGVAAASSEFRVVIIAAIAAAFAESISMAAVAYTSFKAEHESYLSEANRERCEVETMPKKETSEIRAIYRKLGFSGSLLERIVKHITSDKRRWVNVMMEQELKLQPQKESPLFTAIIVGVSAFIGSVIPVIPFLLLPVKEAIIPALIISTIVLFFVGAYKAMSTVGNPLKSGIEMALIGMVAAMAGYGVGSFFGVLV
jgi:VIT1/CCC1 family predicted Fe2+/Mn2+ transporter